MRFHLIILSINEFDISPPAPVTKSVHHYPAHSECAMKLFKLSCCWLLVIRIVSRLNRSKVNVVLKCINKSCAVDGRVVEVSRECYAFCSFWQYSTVCVYYHRVYVSALRIMVKNRIKRGKSSANAK